MRERNRENNCTYIHNWFERSYENELARLKQEVKIGKIRKNQKAESHQKKCSKSEHFWKIRRSGHPALEGWRSKLKTITDQDSPFETVGEFLLDGAFNEGCTVSAKQFCSAVSSLNFPALDKDYVFNPLRPDVDYR